MTRYPPQSPRMTNAALGGPKVDVKGTRNRVHGRRPAAEQRRGLLRVIAEQAPVGSVRFLLRSLWPSFLLLLLLLLFLLRQLLLFVFFLVLLTAFVSHACSFSAIVARHRE